MPPITNVYLIIFLPLIASLVCQMFGRKSTAFLFTFASLFTLLLLTISIFNQISSTKVIASNFSLSAVSIALEFKLDIIGWIFLILVIFIKIVSLFFYFSDVRKLLDVKGNRIFYSVFLLNLFGLMGIFTTNNFFNLFLFLEIYTLSFFALSSISNDNGLLNLTFRYFRLNAVGSLLMIFCFFIIYLMFKKTDFGSIATDFNLLSHSRKWLVLTIFMLLTLSLVIKFFPLWLHFEKFKSSNVIASFLATESLFIKTIVGIFIWLKITHYFFKEDLILQQSIFLVIMVGVAISLILYSSFKLNRERQLILISAYSSLNNLGFILLCFTLHNHDSMQAMFFYLLNFSSVGFALFVFGAFLKRYFATSSIEEMFFVRETHLLLTIPFKILILFVATFPLTMLFFANWYFVSSIFVLNLRILLLGLVFISVISYGNLAINLIVSLFSLTPTDSSNSAKIKSGLPLDIKKYQFYLMSFWLLIGTISILSINFSFTNKVASNFASYIHASDQ